jgi:hypothetical protein
MKKLILPALFIVFLFSAGCSHRNETRPASSVKEPFGGGSKPYTRYWWFASEIQKKDIRYNLDWLKANGFGGVEIAWVYPLNRFNPLDTTYTPRQEWLSPEWTQIVEYAVHYADSIGMGCDLTFGTLWPFGDSKVTFDQATQKFGDAKWRQVITRSWEHPKPGYVIDHLTPENYKPYFERLTNAFPKVTTRIPQNWFIDSWEVETEHLWANGFDKEFKTRFGYDIVPFMDSIYTPRNAGYLYDYMSLISEKVIRFYKDFDTQLNSAGVMSRGQVSGAPCDLISGYASLDIPEGESMLFEPEFCSIPASAALLSGKNRVSSESFTCLYGWPRDYIRTEQTADLKLVADALFANGINQIIWHGKPHNPAFQDTVNFYASTHIGPTGSIAGDLKEFNKYLETVSSYMKKGNTYSDIGVYLPSEDAWMAGVMPKEKQFIWAWGSYEMRYVYFPDELAAYNPVWINSEFLEKGVFTNGVFKVGNAEFKVLYFNSKYLDYKVIKLLSELTDHGLKVVLRQIPSEPGTVRHSDYDSIVERIKASRPRIGDLPENFSPFLSGTDLPRHWVRKEGKTIYVFFPNPKSDRLKFPLSYGQSFETADKMMNVILNLEGIKYPLELRFRPYQSLLYRIENGKAEAVDIEFDPKIPVIKERPAGFKAPWLVN